MGVIDEAGPMSSTGQEKGFLLIATSFGCSLFYDSEERNSGFTSNSDAGVDLYCEQMREVIGGEGVVCGCGEENLDCARVVGTELWYSRFCSRFVSCALNEERLICGGRRAIPVTSGEDASIEDGAICYNNQTSLLIWYGVDACKNEMARLGFPGDGGYDSACSRVTTDSGYAD